MLVNGKHYRSIWFDSNEGTVSIIDQTQLPFDFSILALKNTADCATAIATMQVRGAPLIGATGAYGMYLATQESTDDVHLKNAYQQLLTTRPTAVNLQWALDQSLQQLLNTPATDRLDTALRIANQIADEDAHHNQTLGKHAATLMQEQLIHKRSDVFQILTHCNAGWLATVDWGTALSGIFQLHDAGTPIHVWVDETRPRNQGASLTAWELNQQGIPHTVIADNTSGHLMQHNLVDCCIVGTDRTTASGDVCNKIGTYPTALCAYDNDIPFYVAAPASSIDWTIADGIKNIPIEQRAEREVSHIRGRTQAGKLEMVQLVPDGTPCINFAFDVTPAKYITKIITERGAADANTSALANLFPEHQKDLIHE